MEDYDKFVGCRLSQQRRSNEDNNKPRLASSLIRFYGQPILAPVLSRKQREEMQRHGDEARKAAECRKSPQHSRMACVQTILHSVQLRKTPTLEELLQESEIYTKSSSNENRTGSVSHFVFPKDNLAFSPSSEQKEKDNVSLPLLTSTTCSAFSPSRVTPQLCYHEGSLMNQHDNQQRPLPSHLNGASHQSVSSGYVTYDNVKNTISVSERMDMGSESHEFVSTERDDSMAGFFLRNTLDTVAKVPDIISYPPVDAEELERSGLESSICDNLITGDTVKDICCSQDYSVNCTHLPGDNSGSTCSDVTKSKESTPIATLIDQNGDKNDSTDSSLKSKHLADSLKTDGCPSAEIHIHPRETEPVDSPVEDADSNMSEEPNRFSLQALLKKSQEYRRRQRTLRNQAKHTKIQEQPREKTEEHSLSDKENDENSNKGTVTAEQKESKERGSTFIPRGVEISLRKLWEETKSEEIFAKPHFTFESTQYFNVSAEEETVSRNNMLNTIEFRDINSFSQKHPTWTVSTRSASSKVPGKYHTIPALNFCLSPVHCKGSSKSAHRAVKKTSDREFVFSSGVDADQKVEEDNSGQANSPAAAPSTVNVVTENNVTNVLAKSSQHLDQLEFNLSGLKVLISDLESTLKENMENNSSQNESSLHSDVCSKTSQPNDSVFWEEDDTTDKHQKYRELLRRQSLESSKNMCEEPSISGSNDLPLIEQEKQTQSVNLRDTMLVKRTQKDKESDAHTDLAKSCGSHSICRKLQQSNKCILSAAEHLQVPDVFQTLPSETMAPYNVSVLSDTSNHTVAQKNKPDVSNNSTQSPSLNQSYDVDTPSELWLHDGSGSDLGSKGHLVQKKHLTPESGAEDQGGVSKVKRRLLMHVTEDTRGGNISRAASPVVRPKSSTLKAAVHSHEGHGSWREKQEQLKQIHAAQIRALQEEHRRQQEELIQALAVRYRLLQSVSFPCSMPTSHRGDTLTFPTISQPSRSLQERYRPLLLAAIKGFLTRRLLRTQRVSQLVRTIRDTQQFLQACSRGELCSRQDLLLQQRVALQLRAARYEVYDIFFSMSAGERMQLIRWDRELVRERAFREKSGHIRHPRGQNTLSAATQKSLERKRGILIQKKAIERHGGVAMRTGHTSRVCAEQPLDAKPGQFRANPQRVPKSTYSSRPR